MIEKIMHKGDNSWHFNPVVNLALILTVLTSISAGIYKMGQLSSEFDLVKSDVVKLNISARDHINALGHNGMIGKIIRIETNQNHILDAVEEIKRDMIRKPTSGYSPLKKKTDLHFNDARINTESEQ